MPDLKISQLPAASTPLAGTELVPIVQGGTTDQTTVQAILTSAVPSGTANGVLFLNGSKVVTSGSALTFDGTNLGIGAGAAANGVQINASNGGYVLGKRNGTNAWFIGDTSSALGSGTGTIFYNYALGAPWIWQLDVGGEQMRLTSTGLGIGTSSPAYKLDVRGLITGGNGTIIGGISYSTRPEIGAISNHPCGFITNNMTQMLLDTSGNLGLGVAPSAWSLGKAFQVNSLDGAVVWGYAGAAQFGNNFYYNGGYLYATTAAATRYVQSSGAHQWFISTGVPSAGSPISFTQAMTLSAAGGLSLGDTNDPGSGVGSFNGVRIGGNGSDINSTFSGASSVLTFRINGNERARITSTGSFVAGAQAALATTATDGFLYVPTCAGTPTGTPTAITGMAPIVIDTTNNKLYFYSGGQWRDAGP